MRPAWVLFFVGLAFIVATLATVGHINHTRHVDVTHWQDNYDSGESNLAGKLRAETPTPGTAAPSEMSAPAPSAAGGESRPPRCPMRVTEGARAARPAQAHQLHSNRFTDLRAGLELVPPHAVPRYNTCAVVASSGSLLGSSYGAEIDAADAVIRCNHGMACGPFASDVGCRTTWRVMVFHGIHPLATSAHTACLDDKSGLCAPWDVEEGFLLWSEAVAPLFAPNWEILKTRHALKNGTRWSCHDCTAAELAAHSSDRLVKVWMHTREEMNFAKDTWARITGDFTGMHAWDEKFWLSTGYFAALKAMQLCDHVRLYGYYTHEFVLAHVTGTMPPASSMPRYYYYDTVDNTFARSQARHWMQPFAKNQAVEHNFVAEKLFYSRLDQMCESVHIEPPPPFADLERWFGVNLTKEVIQS